MTIREIAQRRSSAWCGRSRPRRRGWRRPMRQEQRRRCRTPAFCSRATPMPAAVMKAALRTLTAATTRARRSAPAQACTAENAGTMNRPPAMARPARSIAMCRPRLDLKTVRQPIVRCRGGSVPGGPAEIERKQSRAARGEQRRQQDDRPCASHEARPEPMAIAIANTARNAVMTVLVAADHRLDQRRQERQHHRADEPEPARRRARPTTTGVPP